MYKTSRRKVLSKITILQKVLSNIKHTVGCFWKIKNSLNLRSVQDVPAKSSFKIASIQRVFSKEWKVLQIRTGGPGEKFFQKYEDCRKCFQTTEDLFERMKSSLNIASIQRVFSKEWKVLQICEAYRRSRRKVLSKIGRLQKVLSNITNLQRVFSKE